MAFPTGINNLITDLVSQSGVEVLNQSAAIAAGNFYVATSQALANAAHNATNNQQQAFISQQAVLTQSVSSIFMAVSSPAPTPQIFA